MQFLRRYFLIVVLSLLLLSAGVVALPGPLLRWLTIGDNPVPSDGIVLLAGSMHERAPTAAMLYRAGYAPRVLVSDDGIFSSYSPEHNRNLYQVEWAEEELVRRGVPRRALIRLPCLGKGTVYEALATRRAIAGDIRSLTVVTSEYHTRRAGWIFQQVLGRRVAVLTFPAQSAGVGRGRLLAEVVKLVYYRVRFGMIGWYPKV